MNLNKKNVNLNSFEVKVNDIQQICHPKSAVLGNLFRQETFVSKKCCRTSQKVQYTFKIINIFRWPVKSWDHKTERYNSKCLCIKRLKTISSVSIFFSVESSKAKFLIVFFFWFCFFFSYKSQEHLLYCRPVNAWRILVSLCSLKNNLCCLFVLLYCSVFTQLRTFHHAVEKGWGINYRDVHNSA